jgi:hypothetical protein
MLESVIRLSRRAGRTTRKSAPVTAHRFGALVGIGIEATGHRQTSFA